LLETDDLLVELRDGGALWLTFNRPEVFNAFSGELSVALAERLEGAAVDDDVRVVVLTGAGAAFSAGADISGEDAVERFDVRALDAANRIIRAVTGCPKPVVAAVNGVAAGVGCSTALAADLVVAAESASFLLAFTRIGLMPDGGTSATVAAAIGRARAMRMALLAEPLPAREAYDAGLASHLATDADFPELVETIVHRLARRASCAGGHQEGGQRRDPRPARARPGAGAHRPDRAAAHRRRGRRHAGVRGAPPPRVPRVVSTRGARVTRS
jgi:enoyl-CoA hydratase